MVNTTELQEQDLATSAIQKLDMNEAKIAEFKENYGSLQIAGLSDREGYEAVRVAIQKLRTTRTTLEAKRKELKEPFRKAGELIDSHAKKYIARIEEIEKPLQSEKDKIDEEKERIRIAKEQEEQARINSRVASLFEARMSFNGNDYSLGDIVITPVMIKVLSEQEWTVMLERVQVAAEEIKAAEALAEQERQAEIERIEREKAEEEKRLKEERYLLDKQRAEMEAEARKIREQQEAALAEQEKRMAEIKRIEQEQIDNANRLKAQAADLRIHQLKAVGLEVGIGTAMCCVDGKIEFETNLKPLFEMTEEQFAEELQLLAEVAKEWQAVQAVLNQKREAEEKERTKQIAAEQKAREEAMKPEKEKLYSLVRSLEAVESPIMATPQGQVALDRIKLQFTQFLNFINEEASAI